MDRRVFYLCLVVLLISLGCLGGGGGGGGGIADISPSGLIVSGRAFFADRSLYGGIPILVRDPSGRVVVSTRTDNSGRYGFATLAPGVYDLIATTGDSEIVFESGVQITPGTQKDFSDKSLICLKTIDLDRIGSTSLRLRFLANMRCTSALEYWMDESDKRTVQVSTSFATSHQIDLSGLLPTVRYGFNIILRSEDGQKFSFSALDARTTSAIGPTLLGISIEDGAFETRSTIVNLGLSAQGATEMRLGDSEDLSMQPWESYSPTRTYTLPAGNGTVRVYAQFRDTLRNESPIISDAIVLNTLATGYLGVWINSGKPFTSQQDVVLTLLYPGAAEMRISDRKDFYNAFWEFYSEIRKWKISAGDGTKNVYVQFRGGGADPNTTYSTSILLDTTGPEVAMSINGGAEKTNNRTVRLDLVAKSPAAEMQIASASSFTASDSWIPYTTPYFLTLSTGDEKKTVYARFRDELENIYGPISSEITLDTTPPSEVSFTINSAASTTNSILVRLAVTAKDASRVNVSNTVDFIGAASYSFFGTSRTIDRWPLSGYGLQTVYVTCTDDASNTSDIVSQEIEVVGTPTGSGVVTINEGDPSSDRATGSLLLQSTDAVKFRLSPNINFSSIPDQNFVPNAPNSTMRIATYPLKPKAGEQFVFARFENASGVLSFASDSILLVGPTNYTLSTVDAEPLTNYAVNLNLYAVGATQSLITEDFTQLDNPTLWVPFQSRILFALTPEPRSHTIYAKYRNIGGVETDVMTLTVQTTGSSVASPSFLINGGDLSTPQSVVIVQPFNVGSYSTMTISETGNFAGIPSIPSIATNHNFTNKEAGSRTLYVRFRHDVSGAYLVASSAITLVGPTNAAISTNDVQPLNATSVNLNLTAQGVTGMLISESLASMTAYATGDWLSYVPTYRFPLRPGGGSHTIYAKFRNSTAGFVETAVLSLTVDVRDTVPTGNSADFKVSAVPTSTTVTSIPTASLPAFLHFSIADTGTKYVNWQLTRATDPAPTALSGSSSIPVSPISYAQGDLPGTPFPGVYNLWYKFFDGVGNETALSAKPLEILGPEIIVSPKPTVPFRSAQTWQFTATLKNVTGTVRWRLAPDSPSTTYGHISPTTGMYTAPAIATSSVVATVTAYLLEGGVGPADVGIALTTQIEVVPSVNTQKIVVGRAKDTLVTFVNSDVGGTVEWSATGAGGFTATISTGIAVGTDWIATLTATSPASLIGLFQNPIFVTVRSASDTTKTSTVSNQVIAGESISAIPATATVRLRTGVLNVTADPTLATDVTWLVQYGGFDPTLALKTVTTSSPNHVRTYYAPLSAPPGNIEPISVWFMDGIDRKEATCTITLAPYVSVDVTPGIVNNVQVAKTTQYTFNAVVENATTSQVVWSFRVGSDTYPWYAIDSGVQIAGKLESLGYDAIYTAPAGFPGGNELLNKVEFRAVSKDDVAAFDLATATLIPPVRVLVMQYDNATSQLVDWTGSTTSMLLEVDTKQWIASVSNAVDTTVKWYVNGVLGGDATYGTVSLTGLYTSPGELPSPPTVNLRCVSNADAAASASVDIGLRDFWTRRSTNMKNDSGTDMPIYSVLVDPVWPEPTDPPFPGDTSKPFWLFAGTNGYGVWFASASADATGATAAAQLDWIPTPLATKNLFAGARYVVNDLAFNVINHDVAAATEDGVYIFRSNGIRSYMASATVALGSCKALAWDKTNPNYLYLSRDYGVERIVFTNAAAGNYANVATPLYCSVGYREYVTRTDSTASPPVDVTALNNSVSYLFTGPTRAIALSNSDPNLLYFGNDVGEFGALPNVRTTISPLSSTIEAVFLSNTGVTTVLMNTFKLAIPSPPVPRSEGLGIITDISIDPNSPWTMLLSSSTGLRRSINGGTSFSPVAGSVNTRATSIDPTNTINFYYGCEDGLYRSKNAGVAWTQIKSGLGGHKVINAFTQTEGPPGSKRRIWVGTTGGIFADGRSLDLE